MSYTDGDAARSRFEQLSRNAALDLIIPKSVHPELVTLIQEASGEIGRVPQRRNLFFDENVSISVVLKTDVSEPDAREALADLELHLSAHATEAIPQGQSNAATASGKHDLNSLVCSSFDDLEVTTLDDSTFIIMKQSLHLSRPRLRLQRPAVYFTANFTIRQEVLREARKPERSILPSFVPLPANVLAPLRADPVFGSSNITLSDTRVTKVAPRAPSLENVVKPIRGVSKRAIPTVPALFPRIRYSALPEEILASVHLETSNLVTGSVHIGMTRVECSGIDVQPVLHAKLPLETYAGDETVLLFRLLKPPGWRASDHSQTITTKVDAIADLENELSTNISFSWQTPVDTTSLMSPPPHKWTRPLSTSTTQTARLSALPNSRPTTSEGVVGSSEDNGSVVFHFSSPAVATVGEDFRLHVQCNNQSSRSRRFALVMHQKSKLSSRFSTGSTLVTKQSSKKQDSSTTTISRILGAALGDDDSIPRPRAILDLNPDVRVGPLPPGHTYETRMTFRALQTGVIPLGTLHIVDVDTRRTAEVRELPEIVAVAAEARRT